MTNPRLIYHLRNHPHPVERDVLAHLYDEPGRFEQDVERLQRCGLVAEHDGRLLWAGS